MIDLTLEEHLALYEAAKAGVQSFDPHPTSGGRAMSGSRRHYRERKHLLAAVRKMENAVGMTTEHRFKA